MKFLIAQGSSGYNIKVVCIVCHKEFVWLKLYTTKEKGVYKAICRECKMKYFKEENGQVTL